jgi:squalene-associated FAD-dependent desaturase
MSATDDQQQALARKKSTLARAFKIAGLGEARTRAMEILYTFCRVADDIVDEPGLSDSEKHTALDLWRTSIRGCFDAPGGAPPHDKLAGELAEIVREYRIPMEPLLEILDGCEMDIGEHKYTTAAELHTYCHGVACAVGLASIRVFGCVSPLSDAFAVALGYALQFTNILRDVVEDYRELGRVYLPREEMDAFGVKPEDLAAPDAHPACARLFQLQYFRAKHYFNKARRLIAPEDFAALKAARIMAAFYEAILEKIKDCGFSYEQARMRRTHWERVRILRRVLAQRSPVTAARSAATAGARLPLLPGRVVVVGAGVAGIAAAVEAALRGDTVTLLEAGPVAGGRAGLISGGSAGGGAGGRGMDSGHHALFGCYRAFFRLADTLGVRGKLHEASRLDVPYRSPGGRVSRLRAVRLPAPLHLAGALIGFDEVSWRDRFAIFRFGGALRLGLGRPRPGESAAAWLARHRQTPGALRALWEPFCVAALNEPLATGCAALLETTLRRTLFGGVKDSAIVAAADALGRLFDPELALYLRAIGGELRVRARVRELRFSGERVSGVVLANGDVLAADAVISAVPWAELPRLLPQGEAVGGQAAQLRGNPILNVHLFTKVPLAGMEEPLAALLDSPVQWIFREGDGGGAGAGGLCHYALTLSCPGGWMEFPNGEILRRVKSELARFFPEVRDEDFAEGSVCKYPLATFAAVPGAAAFRPGTKTRWPNLFLAGDWTDTGLPATLESAAQSGQAAAKAFDA